MPSYLLSDSLDMPTFPAPHLLSLSFKRNNRHIINNRMKQTKQQNKQKEKA